MADKLKAIDIAERILQASDIIASEKLKHLNYDRTINGTIVSADNATNGEYTVDDGSTTFLAYSKDTDYKVGDSVYVTVQNGDWSLQKLITGRYVKDDTKPFAYKSPLDSFLDITDNLVGDGWRNQNQWALLANSDLESPKRYTSTMDIWKIGYTYTKENVIYSEMMDSWQQEGYTKVAISADFRTRLQDNTISGDYGLELVLYDFTRHQDDSVSILPHIFTFSCRDMFGNPYNFLVNSTQSIVLNLDNLNTIVGAKIVFYQRNNFKDADKQSLVPNNLPPNIFLSNLYVSFGYDKENFDGETVLLYSLGKDTYLSESLPKRQDNPAIVDTSANERKMSIRWIHQNDDLSYNCIDQPSEIPWYQRTASEKATKANIHFYRYNLDENDTYDSDSDSVGELAWKELNTSPIRYSISNNKFAFSYTMNPALQHEMFKVLIEYPTADYITNFLMPNDGYSLTDLSNELNTLEALDNPTDAQSARIEEIEAIINSYVSQIQYYESNILEFINESQVPNLITLELVKGLRIECDKDGYNGNFQCYRDDNQIANQAEAYKVRFLRAVWNTAVIQEYEGTTDIYWYIPAANTMIAPPIEGKTFNVENGIQTDDWGMVATGQPHAGMWFFHYQDIERADTSEHTAGSNIACQMEQGFQIKNNYNYQRNNNKVYCVITKNNHEYEAEFDMTFGISGNNGTKYTFNLDILGGKPAITLANNDQLEIVPHLYNQNNVEITNQFLNNINYEWYSQGNDGLSMSEPDANRHIFISYNSTNMDDCDYYILKATVTQVTHNQRQVNLCAYLPIAVRAAANYEAIDGGWTITYDSSGANPAYYKDPWNLYTRIDNILQPVVTRWSMKLGPDTDNLSSFSGTPRENKERYYPSITEDTRVLVPTSLKMTGIGKNIAVRAGSLWSQPIMITSYAYESEMMNAWDGSLTIDEKNGTILSAMLGAGVKNPDNTFSGVLMGDVSSKARYANTAIGLYGYHSGNQSFGFKVDGTAFLGKQGRGRIIFDGNKGTIASSSYTGELGTGMSLDLDDGRIHILGAKRTELSQITTYEFEYDENGNHVMDDQGKYKVKDSITKTYTFQKSGAEIEIKPWSPYFSIKSRNNPLAEENNVSNPFTELIHIGDDALYLQTVDYQEGKSGVKLDLRATVVNPANGTTNASGGSIKAYGNFNLQAIDASGSSIRLSNDPTEFFKIHYKGSSPVGDLDLIKVSKNSFVMQSPNYTSSASVDTSGDSQAAGVKIDLVNGTIDAKKLYIKTQQFDLTAYQTNNSVNTGLEIHSNGNPYIRFIYNYGSPSPKNILDITSNGTYTLQSINFEQEEKLLGPAYGSGKKIWVGTGTKIDLKRGRIDLYGTTPCTVGNENETRSGAWVSIASDVAQMLDVHYGYDSSGNDIYLLRVGSSNLYLQSANYDTTNHKGMKIDLSNGKITGYNLTLTGYSTDASNATVNGWVNLDTTQPTYPLAIGSGNTQADGVFKVDWSGKLYATGAEISGVFHLDSDSDLGNDYLNTLATGKIGGWLIYSDGNNTAYLAHGTRATENSAVTGITHYLGTEWKEDITINGYNASTGENGGWVFKAGSNFAVTNNGTLYANNAVISGTLTIGSSSTYEGTDLGNLNTPIGQWTIGSTGLYYGGTVDDNTFAPGYYLGPPKRMVIPNSNNNDNKWIDWDGNGSTDQEENTWSGVVFKAGPNFFVTTNGTLYANNGNFTGTIKGSTIQGSTVKVGTYTYTNEDDEEVSVDKIVIDQNGTLTAYGAVLNYASIGVSSIGSLSIGGKSLKTGSITCLSRTGGCAVVIPDNASSLYIKTDDNKVYYVQGWTYGSLTEISRSFVTY